VMETVSSAPPPLLMIGFATTEKKPNLDRKLLVGVAVGTEASRGESQLLPGVSAGWVLGEDNEVTEALALRVHEEKLPRWADDVEEDANSPDDAAGRTPSCAGEVATLEVSFVSFHNLIPHPDFLDSGLGTSTSSMATSEGKGGRRNPPRSCEPSAAPVDGLDAMNSRRARRQSSLAWRASFAWARARFVLANSARSDTSSASADDNDIAPFWGNVPLTVGDGAGEAEEDGTRYSGDGGRGPRPAGGSEVEKEEIRR